MISHTVTVDELTTALARWQTEATSHTVSTGRYTMPYHIWGAGPRTLVVVHGMNDIARSFAMLLQYLVTDFRCVAIELPNGIDDDAILGQYRHSDYSHDLIALLDALGVEDCDLLGSSFGSTIALRTAAMFPNRIRNLVVQGGFARRPLHWAERGLARLGRYWPWRMGELILRESAMRKFEADAFVSAPHDIFEFLIANSATTPMRAVARRALMLHVMDLRPLLPLIQCPTLMIGGDRDTLVPRCWEAEVEAGVPNVRRIEYPRCGHYPQYTHPRPMADAMRAFFLGREYD